MICYGLTGTTGAGKSTVAAALRNKGFFVIDGDLLARRVVLPGSPVLRQIADTFGSDLILPDGTLDRKLLVRRTAETTDGVATLNAITHPAIDRLVQQEMEKARRLGYTRCVFDAAALLESPSKARCSKIIVVTAPREVRLQRILQRDGLTEAQAIDRMNMQKDDDWYLSQADIVIRNYPPYALSDELRKITAGKPRKRRRKRRLKPAGYVVLALLALALLFGGVTVRNAVMHSLYPLRYDDFVETYTRSYDLEKSFIFAVIKCESSFDPGAVSKVGARGLMQIMPETYHWLQSKTGESGDDDALFDPETSVRYGCMLFSILLEEFADERVAVCAYHAGIGNVEKWLQDPQYSDDGKTLKAIPFPSTAHYADKVMRVREIYRKLYKL